MGYTHGRRWSEEETAIVLSMMTSSGREIQQEFLRRGLRFRHHILINAKKQELRRNLELECVRQSAKSSLADHSLPTEEMELTFSGSPCRTCARQHESKDTRECMMCSKRYAYAMSAHRREWTDYGKAMREQWDSFFSPLAELWEVLS